MKESTASKLKLAAGLAGAFLAARAAGGIPTLIALVVGLIVGYVAAPNARRIMTEIPVSREVASQGEPGPVSGFGRIQRRTVGPTVTRTAKGGAAQDVASFCGEAGYVVARADSVTPSEVASGEPIPLPDRLDRRSFIRSGRRENTDLELWYVQPDGDLSRALIEGVHEPYDFYTTGDSVAVNVSRWWWVDEAAIVGACSAYGVLANEGFESMWAAYLTSLAACAGTAIAF